jgi:hypothetical protein
MHVPAAPLQELTGPACVQVLDESAFALCKENDIPVVVFNLHEEGNILRAAQGSAEIGTVVNSEPDTPGDRLPAPGSPEDRIAQHLHKAHQAMQL